MSIPLYDRFASYTIRRNKPYLSMYSTNQSSMDRNHQLTVADISLLTLGIGSFHAISNSFAKHYWMNSASFLKLFMS